MRELDMAVLVEDLPAHGLEAGDIGTVVLVHVADAGYEVEFATLEGETVAVVTVRASKVRSIASQEIAHARALAG